MPLIANNYHRAANTVKYLAIDCFIYLISLKLFHLCIHGYTKQYCGLFTYLLDWRWLFLFGMIRIIFTIAKVKASRTESHINTNTIFRYTTYFVFGR